MASAHTIYKMIAEEEGGFEERNELILQELPQVHYIASRMMERLPQHVELGDLVHAGVIGLLEAYRTFDNTKNAQFKTFAKFRIKGAILDSLRALDWGSRGIRRKAREIAEATLKLEGALGRSPSKEEISAELGLTIADLNEIQTQLNGLHLVGQEVTSSFEGETAHDLIESAPSSWDNPFEMYAKAESKAHLIRAISELSEREQLILSLYYREELTMKEVAEVVGLAVSRVSQIHSAVLAKLKAALGHLAPEDVSKPKGVGPRAVLKSAETVQLQRAR
ncbi:sigma-70 family RNA polymerase sigma factor [Granulicella tundricola]|uniref:RNA polymerase, sigma 28 subunit, FliA/WhiG n=1 Tax=Granulicella tundricola (strain ATCC BAA-1859 / DSM 23138 / MP5ACTX9) TaxID=1198114 RepID=E8X627_GRATM|nr:FliA/WhiG family RNA polymerase sigma factor [Granulicella tundricola]ADW70911.1 RNA polymerase, sigma 28 subunit, FliA/WhiG [Granulicella tundricola MP5ACTX9]